MDDFDVAANGVPFVVFRHLHHQTVLDKHVAVLFFGRVLVANAQHLQRSWHASSLANMACDQLQPLELYYVVYVIVRSRTLRPADLGPVPLRIEPRFSLGRACSDLVPQPPLSIHRPLTLFVL